MNLSRHFITSGLVVSLLLATGLPARSQIDNRVNTGNTAVAGRALDSNPAVGSNRFNLTRPGLNVPGARANAIITGNVTGLAGFHGDSPIVNNNQFRDSLPSSGLSGFQARGVGIEDVLGDRALGTNYYLGRAETVTDAGFVRSGLNRPGSSSVLSTATPPPSANFVTDDSTASLLQQLRKPEDLRVQMSTPDLKPGVTQTDLSGAKSPAPSARAGGLYRDALRSSIFGVPPPTFPATGAGLTRPRATTDRGGGLLGQSGRVDRAATLMEDPALKVPIVTEDPSARRVESLATALPPGSDEGSALERRADSLGAATGAITPAGSIPPELLPVAPEKLGDDRFADLFSAVSAAQSLGVRSLGFDLPTAAADAATGVVAQTEGAAPPADRVTLADRVVRRPTEGMKELAAAAKWASDVIENPVTTFAGAHRNQMNEYMRLGEELLHAGRYYDAARRFDQAATIDPMNPLPLLARGHALAAAGDYRSAVRALVQGIERFPQIAAFRIDLPAMIRQTDVFDLRRADLEKMLSLQDIPELRFLLGYLEWYSELPEEGLKNLRHAAAASPPDSVIGMFADLVTGQRELPPLKP